MPVDDRTWDWGEVIPAVIAVLALLSVAYLAVFQKSAGAEAGLLALLGAASGTYYRRPPRADGGGNGNGNGSGYSNGNGGGNGSGSA
jgi:uncharacterized membrane protein YgcG